MTNFLLPLILSLVLSLGCSSQCALGYYTLYDKEVVFTKTYEAQHIGDYGDDWQSTSGDKIQDVTFIDNNFIFLSGDAHALEITFALILDGDTLKSIGFVLPRNEDTLTVTFLSDTAPDGDSWTLSKFNQSQGLCADNNLLEVQSYKFYRQPRAIVPWNITEVGLIAVIQLKAVNFRPELRVISFEKVLKYTL